MIAYKKLQKNLRVHFGFVEGCQSPHDSHIRLKVSFFVVSDMYPKGHEYSTISP